MGKLQTILSKLRAMNILEKLKLDKISLDKKKKIFIVLSCLIFLSLDFTILIKLQLESIGRITPKIVKLQKEADDLSRGLKKMEELKNNPTQINENLRFKIKKFISGEQVASLLKEISDLADTNKVRIVQMRPAKGAQDKEKSAMLSKFTLLLVSLDLYCDYHHLGKFINDLENNSYFVAVQELKVVSQQADYFKHKVNLALKTYVRK